MKVYTELSGFLKQQNTVITVGSFDGLHKGHYKIIDKLIDVSKKENGTSVLLTFNPHPREVVSKTFDFKILTTLDEKINLLEKTGLDHLVIQKFTGEFSQMTSDEFIKKILVDGIGASHIVVGHDHKFGKDRLGDEDKLRELGKMYSFDVTAVPAETLNGEIISSTKIRNSLSTGDVDTAAQLLGRNYSFTGIVVKGAQRGRQLGFPTANIQPDENKKAVPQKGVYAVHCKCAGENLYGVMNIGLRPTFENKNEIVIEVHLLDFSRDIYGERLTVEFMKHLRDERKFASKEDLIHQIEEDKLTAKKIFADFEKQKK